MTWLHCAAGGKKITNRLAAITTKCWDIGAKCPQPHRGWVCEEIVRNHLECPSLLCILSFQDWLSMDEEIRYPNVDAERINVPANPRHYWRYRMHLTLEELMKSNKFNEKMKEMIDAAGRF